MDVLLPRSLGEALEMKSVRPDARPIAGGTDVMVDINMGHLRPSALIDVSRLPELDVLHRENGGVFVGAGVTYSRMLRELHDPGPMLQAARSVGSPQIRRKGTVGGNLGTASPAGDTLPVLAAYEAEIEVASASRGVRGIAWGDFLRGPKRTSLEPDELILGSRWRVPLGTGSFSKVGPRNAMAIAVVGLCLVLDVDRRAVSVALGSVGPTVVRATAAEAVAIAALNRIGAWEEPRARLTSSDLHDFGERVAGAARPIDDPRGTAVYRRHACAVLAERALVWAMDDRC